MNNNDPFSSAITPEFTGSGSQPPFTADYSNRDNGLIYTSNKKTRWVTSRFQLSC